MSVVRAEGVFCADASCDEWVRSLVERSAALVVDSFGPDSLEAVILTGSSARGEVTVLRQEGGLRMLGDVEMLVIVQPNVCWPESRRRAVALGRRATTEFGDDGRVAKVEYVTAGPAYLRALRPSIFTCDLTHHGRVVWGRPDVLSALPRIEAGAIPRVDAVRLIMNRIMELVLIEQGVRDARLDRLARGYQLAKTLLDLAGSTLAFRGSYVSSYGGRAKPFLGLLDAEPRLADALTCRDGFAQCLRQATQCKLAPASPLLEPWMEDRRVAEVLDWAKGLWLWEMRELAEREAARFVEMVSYYLDSDSYWVRFKGWVRCYRHPLRTKGAVDLVKAARLLSKGSPPSLAYAAAMLAIFGASEGVADASALAASLLPLRVNGSRGVAHQAATFWDWLVRMG